jgi:hypothetical protein
LKREGIDEKICPGEPGLEMWKWKRKSMWKLPQNPKGTHSEFSYTSGGRGFSYCSGAACREDLAEQGVFGPFCAFKKDNKPKVTH